MVPLSTVQAVLLLYKIGLTSHSHSISLVYLLQLSSCERQGSFANAKGSYLSSCERQGSFVNAKGSYLSAHQYTEHPTHASDIHL